MLLSSIQTGTKFGRTVALKVSHPTDFPTRFQGIILPAASYFFVLSHPEEPIILPVQIYFSCILSILILYLSCLQLAEDNKREGPVSRTINWDASSEVCPLG